MPLFDAEKLKENALTSIRLGIEDFQRSQIPLDQGGDPERALSAIRNLFAGVLLLFKYKIATTVDDPKDAATLIFNPPEVLPQADGHGGVEWLCIPFILSSRSSVLSSRSSSNEQQPNTSY